MSGSRTGIRKLPCGRCRDAPGRSNKEPGGPAGKLAASAQVLRRWHQLVATSSTVRELDNEVYQLLLEEQRIFRKQQRKGKLRQHDTANLARLGRLREVADEVKRQRDAAFALEDEAVIAFHDGSEPAEELAKRLAEANRDWDRLLFRLYALNAPSSDSVTLALFAEHRGHLAELAAAYRAVANGQGLTVQMLAYDLPDERTRANPPPMPRPATTPASNPDDNPTVETTLPATAWIGNAFFQTNRRSCCSSASRSNQRTRSTTPRTRSGWYWESPAAGRTSASGARPGCMTSAIRRRAGGVNPTVLALVSTEPLLAYRPPERATRRGFLKERANCAASTTSTRARCTTPCWTACGPACTATCSTGSNRRSRRTSALRLMRLIVE